MISRLLRVASLVGAISLFMNADGRSQTVHSPGPGSCAAEGDLKFVCGVSSAEDLLPIEGGKYLVASSLDPKAAMELFLIDTAAKTGRPMRLSAGATMEPQFKSCPGAPDFKKMFTHGIEVGAKTAETTLVYVIGHGAREAVEVFRVNPQNDGAVWVGCVLLPTESFGNAVSLMQDGSLLITQFYDKRVGQPIYQPTVTGLVFHWTPDGGLKKVPGSEFSGDNGILASKDGKFVFVAAWATDEVWKIPLDGKGTRTSTKFDFRTDNLRWAPDGSILVVGQSSPIRPQGSPPVPEDWVLARLDPETMASTVLLKERGTAAFGNGTSATQVGKTFYFGTYSGDRIAYKDMP